MNIINQTPSRNCKTIAKAKLVFLLLFVGLFTAGCGSREQKPAATNAPSDDPPKWVFTPKTKPEKKELPSLSSVRKEFKTKLVSRGEDYGPAEEPPEGVLDLIHYQSPVGPLVAYLSPDPGDGKKHPAMVWITGGDTNSIGDVWTPLDRSNDQSASIFRESAIMMMYPSQRGGNDNPGQREGFLGEADDILAATDHLAALPYVDTDRIYLGGHSSGGTLALLVAASTDRYKGVFALGPVGTPATYGGILIYCDPNDETEMVLRSPVYWLHSVKCPTYVFEGKQGNIESLQWMKRVSKNPMIQFYEADGHDHFTVIAPLNERIANKIVENDAEISEEIVQDLK